MLAFVIYTHSSYFDIFKIQLDQIKKLFKDLEYDIYVLSDILYTTESGGYSSKKNKRYNKNKRKYTRKINTQYKKKIKGGNGHNSFGSKYKTILYDDKLPYFNRLLNCIKQINYEYICIMHETSLLIRFNNKIIAPLIDAMKNNNIDSLDFRHGSTPEIPIYESLYIGKKPDNFQYLFNVQPTLWRRESIIKLVSNFPNKDYRESEDSDVQNYVKLNMKPYTIFDNNNVLSTREIRCSPTFCYLYITSFRKSINITTETKIEPFIKDEFERILKEYSIKSER
jgi:hypothetical protein